MHSRRWKQVKQCSYNEHSSTWKERVIRKKNVFSPLHPHVEPICPSTVALLQLEEKLVLHAGEEGGKDFFIISKHFKNFVLCHQVAGFTMMLKHGGKH